MAIIKKIPTVSNRFPPLGAVSALGVVALAGLAGWLAAPQRAASPVSDLPQVSSAPEALPPASSIAAPVAAPAAVPAPDHALPRVRRASHQTSAI